MRQAGIIAAGGVYALRHNVERLAEDHANARRLAEGLAELPGVALDPPTVETNLVFFDLTGRARRRHARRAAAAHGVRMGAMGHARSAPSPTSTSAPPRSSAPWRPRGPCSQANRARDYARNEAWATVQRASRSGSGAWAMPGTREVATSPRPLSTISGLPRSLA